MTFKEYKKEHELANKIEYCLEVDKNIIEDIVKISGWYDLTESIQDYYGDPEEYMLHYDAYILSYDNFVFMDDMCLDNFTKLTDGNFIKEMFFDHYLVDTTYEHDDFGTVIKLVHS